MSRSIKQHLTDEEFVSYVLGDLPSDVEREVDAHLEWCRRCAGSLNDYFEAEESFPAQEFEATREEFVAMVRQKMGMEPAPGGIAMPGAAQSGDTLADAKRLLGRIVDLDERKARKGGGRLPLIDVEPRQLVAAADLRISLALEPAPEQATACTLQIDEEESAAGWQTVFSCQIPAGSSIGDVHWRLFFTPEDLARHLSMRPAHLEALRSELGDDEWNRLLDEIVPHRVGHISGSAAILVAVREGRLPGWPTAYVLVVTSADRE